MSTQGQPSSQEDSELEKNDKPSLWKRFLRFHSQQTCVPEAMVSGAGGGLSLLLGTFLFTGNVQKSNKLGTISFAAVYLTAFFTCYYMRYDEIRARHLRRMEEKREVFYSDDKTVIDPKDVIFAK